MNPSCGRSHRRRQGSRLWRITVDSASILVSSDRDNGNDGVFLRTEAFCDAMVFTSRKALSPEVSLDFA